MLFGDSLDSAIVSGVLCFVGFMLGIWAGKIGLGASRLFLLFLFVGVFSAPIAYSLAYIGNWLSGVPETQLFGDSLDSLIVGAILCALGFLLGVIESNRLSKKGSD